MPLSSARRPMSSPRRWCTRRRPFFNPLTGQTSHQTVARPNVSLGPRRRTLSRTHPRPSGTASSRTRPSPRPGRADAPFLGPGDDPFSTPSTAPSRTLISDPSRRRLGPPIPHPGPADAPSWAPQRPPSRPRHGLVSDPPGDPHLAFTQAPPGPESSQIAKKSRDLPPKWPLFYAGDGYGKAGLSQLPASRMASSCARAVASTTVRTVE
jgi:hypothetical protein